MAIRISAKKFAAVATTAMLGLCLALARAETPTPAAGDKAQKETELRGVEDTLQASEAGRRKIEADVEAMRLDRVRLNAALVETTGQVQQTEARAVDAKAQFDGLAARALALNHSLNERRGDIADVLAALERMGADPPPAILVRPDDMAEAVRAAIVISAFVPDLQAKAQAAADDLKKLEGLKRDLARQRDAYEAEGRRLAEERTQLAALVEARQRSLDVAENALAAERKRADDLAAQALTLKDLITRMDTAGAGKSAPDAASAAPPEAKPTIAFAEARGRLSLPASGAILKTFGAPDEFGGVEKGVSLATPAKATVSSPIDGWVAYAGPYRTYGQLLILNAGDGYYMVLAGMERINVTVGQFVHTGEAVAAMGDGSTRNVAAVAIGAAEPVLYIELRKNETAIDPGPWWAKNTIEKARG